MIDYIATLQEGTKVLIGTYGDASSMLTTDAKSSLEQLGATLPLDLAYGDSFSMIGTKGSLAGSATQILNKSMQN